MGETSSFGKVGDDFMAFNTSVIVLVNKKGLNDNEDFVDIRTDEIVKFVEYSINNFDKQVKDFIEKRTCAKFTSLVCDLAKSGLTDRRSAVFNFGEETHDLVFLHLLYQKLSLVRIF
jgi:hypothetical protein